jgi:hypothetical protein
MSLVKITSYVERYANHLMTQDNDVQHNKETFVLNLLKNRLSVKYPNVKITNQTQKLIYTQTESRSIDGDWITNHNLQIIFSKGFIEQFTEKHPEGLI